MDRQRLTHLGRQDLVLSKHRHLAALGGCPSGSRCPGYDIRRLAILVSRNEQVGAVANLRLGLEPLAHLLDTGHTEREPVAVIIVDRRVIDGMPCFRSQWIGPDSATR